MADTEIVTLSSESSDTHSDNAPNKRKQRTEKFTQRKKKRAVVNSPNDDDVLLEQAVAAMNQKSDEFDIFGQYVASEMRQISDSMIRKSVKREIIQAIFNAGNMTVSSNGILSNQTSIRTNALPSHIMDESQLVSLQSDQDSQTINLIDETQCMLEEYEFEFN